MIGDFSQITGMGGTPGVPFFAHSQYAEIAAAGIGLAAQLLAGSKKHSGPDEYQQQDEQLKAQYQQLLPVYQQLDAQLGQLGIPPAKWPSQQFYSEWMALITIKIDDKNNEKRHQKQVQRDTNAVNWLTAKINYGQAVLKEAQGQAAAGGQSNLLPVAAGAAALLLLL